MLITATDVIDLAFNRDINESRIKDSDINVAQWKYIRPALTDSLYTDVINNVANYTEFLTFVKPALAYYVKYLIVEELSFELSDRGIFQLTAQDANGLTDTQRIAFRESILVRANELISVAINYAVEQDLEEYSRANAVEPKIIGGFLIERPTGDIVNTDPSSTSTANFARVWFANDVIYLQERINGVWTNTGQQWDV